MPVGRRLSLKQRDRHMDVENEVENDQDVEMDEGDEVEGGIRIGDIYLPPPPPPACTFDNTGPRLVITHIENYFFKSYAGKQVLGPFHKSFTSIVGPNGSGKSNVIDSMLFVFGYRAQRTRAKKISVLIHNSEAYPDVQSCTVTVHFQKIIDLPGDAFTPLEDTKLAVSRTAYRDSSSHYSVNGRKCQFKAVACLLRQEGIDLDHNRFLILQGEVEQIALMKPKAVTEHDTGMLEFLEDIVGSSRFKEPIELLAKRVEELNEQRTEKVNRVKLVEKEKDALEEPKNAALTHLRLENETVRKQHKLYQRYMLDCSRQMAESEEKKKEIDESMGSIKEKLAEISGQRKAKEEEMKVQVKQMQNVTTIKESSNEKFKALETEDAALQEEMKHKNVKRKKTNAQLLKEQEKLEELSKIPEKNRADIEECERHRAKAEKERTKEEAAYHAAMATLNSETQVLQDEKEAFETQLVDLRKVVDETKGSFGIAQSQLDIYQSREKGETKKLETMRAGLEKAESTITARTEEVSKLEVEIPQMEAQLATAEEKLQQVIAQLAKTEGDLRTRRNKLEETRSAMNSSKSRGKVLDAIMEQKRTGNLPGVFGRLGDLGGIDENYDVAISTACGSLDNILVDTVDTAKRCIEFLKRHNIGLATFIALEKMDKWTRNANSSMQTPENVPRLFDLVHMQETRFKTAFYFAMRDTLVATDLEQASRIAYGQVRHRVVTLKGDLIEPSGTMSGGGKSVLRGKMGKQAAVVSVNPREVEKTEAQVEELTQQTAILRRERVSLEDETQKLTRDLQVLRTNLQKYRMELNAAGQNAVTLRSQMSAQEQVVQNAQCDPRRVKELEAEIAGKQKCYDKAAKSAQGIEEEVTRVHQQIMEITGGRIKSMKKKLEEITKKFEKFNAEITRLQVAIKTSERNHAKTTKSIAEMEAEVAQAVIDLRAMQDRRTVIEDEATKALKDLQDVTVEENKLADTIADLKAEHDQLTKDETRIKSHKIEYDNQIEHFETAIQENKKKVTHWKKEISRMQLQEIPFESQPEDEVPLTLYSPEELDEIDKEAAKLELQMLQEQQVQSKPNLAVIQEYRKKEDVYMARVGELEDITRRRDEQRKFHEDLRKQRLNEFMTGFSIISNKLKEMYQMITLGGDAELELVDSLDPFSEGIVFSVRPPKKSWKNITNLSGGEKTLSSLALVFALHYYKPTPLYVMDEIDAALDFKNVSIVGNYIKERTKNAQFIIISLRSQMFELADRLVGIYKTKNCTQSVTINPCKFGTPVAVPSSEHCNGEAALPCGTQQDSVL